jgi:hypothetical protein
MVQASASTQLRGSLMHEPLMQRSATVQASLSTQSALVKQQPGDGSWSQPEAGTHESMVQGLVSSQLSDWLAVQLPD